MARPITAGLNGTPESLIAVRWAAGEAERRRTRLRLLYAEEWLPPHLAPTPNEPGYPLTWPERLLSDATADVRARHPGLTVSAEQVERQPIPALLDAAKDSDLLVLGSRGLGSIAGFVSGSVSLAVVARAECPVVLVRATEPGCDYGEVIVGLDLHHPSEPLLEVAFGQAAARRATVTVVRVCRPVPTHGGQHAGLDPELAADVEGDERKALQTALQRWREKYPWVAVHEMVVEGNAAHELIRAAAGAALLVIGRCAQRPPLSTHLGAVAHSVIHHAACPVAIVPHD